MSAFDSLQKYYGGDAGNMGKLTPLAREGSPKHPAVADDGDISRVEKEADSEAERKRKSIKNIEKQHRYKVKAYFSS